MNIIRYTSLVLFLAFAGLPAFTQNMSGTTLGNYAGVNSIQVNPSALHNSRTYLDIQLFGLDMFVQNNYLYLDKDDYRFRNFFNPGYDWPVHQEEYGVEERLFYYYNTTRHKNAFVQARLNGPGAMLLWGHHAFAISSSFRTVTSMSHIPDDLANFIYLGLNYTPQQNIRYTDYGPIRGSAMSWGEIGLTYSNEFYARGYDKWSAGITVKRLLGLGGAYINAKQMTYVIPNDSTIDIRNMDATLGVALPVDYTTNDAMTSPLFKGGGFGADVGVTYTRLAHYHQEQYVNSLCAQQYEDYIYRIGVALIDVGGIKFSTNATRMKIDNRSSYWSDVTSLNTSSIGQFLDTLSYQFYGDYTSGYDDNQFTLWLPSALSVQFDYHLQKHWYVNASLIQGFPLANAAVTRPAEFSVTPRYESGWFEASMPVSLYNWQQPRLGLALRIYGVTIGTDKLGGFFHFSDFTGMDAYISLKFSFNKGSCRDKGPEHCGGVEREYHP